jgi:hypothetical protein
VVRQKGHILKLLLVVAKGTVMSHGPIAVGGTGPETERRIRGKGEDVGMEREHVVGESFQSAVECLQVGGIGLARELGE